MSTFSTYWFGTDPRRFQQPASASLPSQSLLGHAGWQHQSSTVRFRRSRSLAVHGCALCMPCTLEAALAAPYCAKVLDDHGVPVNVPNQAEGMVFSYLVLDFLQQTHRGHSQHSLEFPTIWPHWPETTSCNLTHLPLC